MGAAKYENLSKYSVDTSILGIHQF